MRWEAPYRSLPTTSTWGSCGPASRVKLAKPWLQSCVSVSDGTPGYPGVRIRCLYPGRVALPLRAFILYLVSAEKCVFGADLLAKLARVTVLADPESKSRICCWSF